MILLYRYFLALLQIWNSSIDSCLKIFSPCLRHSHPSVGGGRPAAIHWGMGLNFCDRFDRLELGNSGIWDFQSHADHAVFNIYLRHFFHIIHLIYQKAWIVFVRLIDSPSKTVAMRTVKHAFFGAFFWLCLFQLLPINVHLLQPEVRLVKSKPNITIIIYPLVN